MKVDIQPRPATFMFDVWLYEPDVSGVHILNLDGSIRGKSAPGETPEPSFSISEHALKQLVAAGAEHLPPDLAQARHLDDALKVRDRLLDALIPAGSAD